MNALPAGIEEWEVLLAGGMPAPCADSDDGSPRAARQRGRQNEHLVAMLHPFVRGNWRLLAWVIIREGYYPATAHLGNVATTLRTTAQRLGLQRKCRREEWRGRHGFSAVRAEREALAQEEAA